MTDTPSTNQESFRDILPLVRLYKAGCFPRRIAQRVLAGSGLDLRSAVFMLLLASGIAMFVTRGIQIPAPMAGAVGPRLSAAQSPGVHFLSETSSLFDSIPADSLVHVCAHVIDVEIGEQVIMVDRQTYTVRQLQDALKIVAGLKPSASTPEPALSPQQPAPDPHVTGGVVVARDSRPGPSPD